MIATSNTERIRVIFLILFFPKYNKYKLCITQFFTILRALHTTFEREHRYLYLYLMPRN